jgi:glyoxylase-like metal-dependent hydrolase (beta-lactamase superfamily II)
MDIEVLQLQIGDDPHFVTNCYILSGNGGDANASSGSDSAPDLVGAGGTGVVVIDPADKLEQIIAALAGRAVAAIVLTHRHDDHTGAAAQLAAYSGAPVFAHSDDAAAIERPSGRYPFFGRERRSPPKVTRLLADGDVFEAGGLKLEVMHTPGHSAGSICLLDATAGILFSGDTLFFGTCGRTDLPSGSPTEMHASLRRLSQLPQQTKVYPGHELATTIGAELGRGLSEY